ncbi:transcriptional regulator, MerR family [Candidatus Koribacter versatilis Ellin345]|uniref:Transcriptional regulator, MerR family n=1 Tax=Koribacter versatilis (strain Ellin345) TaxID=204669 RepID=Q1IT10_KORVE|nr:heavy metal-responsive transcriptional regulator [Candidatus Koribacter versatilis]ABF39990.1 transcriptional regulator, MerR family [Candidatus Koribacter versatilis Ellin345]
MVQQLSNNQLRSGALAKATGVSPDTVRHYEKIGVLPKASRTQSGYRVYPEAAIERVLVVRRALRIGFTLPELADVLKERDSGGTPCRRVRALAEQKLAAIEAEITALRQTAAYLRSVLSDWDSRLKKAGPTQRSQLLYSLSLAPVPGGRSNRSFRNRSSL